MNTIERNFTKGERRVIREAARVAVFGWHLCTGRTVRKVDAIRLVARGMMQDGGMAVICDGDGFAKEPERYRQSYILTEQGRVFAAALDAEADAELRRRFPREEAA